MYPLARPALFIIFCFRYTPGVAGAKVSDNASRVRARPSERRIQASTTRGRGNLC